jgi:hypothetical protein
MHKIDKEKLINIKERVDNSKYNVDELICYYRNHNNKEIEGIIKRVRISPVTGLHIYDVGHIWLDEKQIISTIIKQNRRKLT